MPDASPPQLNTLSISEVAKDIAVVETCIPVDAHFADNGVRHDGPPFSGFSTIAVTLRAYRLRDVVLDRSLMVLFKEGRVIAETNYLQTEESIAAARVHREHLIRLNPGRLMTTCFDHWDANYYHWFAHGVPTLQAFRQRHAHADIGLVLPQLRPWQQKSLELLDVATLPCVVTEPGAQYLLPEIEYYDFVAGRADFAISPLSRHAYAAMSAEIKGASHRRVYIDRSNATNRRIPNEPSLIERLRQRGFTIARLEELSLEHQIALFKGADMVVGLHGAGLTNIVFCQPGTVVYELVPENYQNPCFLTMALQGDLQYWADVFPTGVDGSDHMSRSVTEVDIDRVIRRIDNLDALIS
jgi:capsular polysaccharide biosynthesis protein